MHVGERFWFAERRDNTLAMAKLTLAEKVPLLPARLAQNHWLHPAGWGPDTDKPSIDKPMAKKVALSN